MCGRFVSARKRLELLEEFGVLRDRAGDDDLAPDYNVAPTKKIYTVLCRQDGPGERERELRVVRWGLVPFWAKDASGGARLINARSETVAEKPAFRQAFGKRRCIIPAEGYYEWTGATNPEGKAYKQPYFIHRSDGADLAFAGIYELWRDKTVPEDDANAFLWTAAVITTKAADEVGEIHDRMPMVIGQASWTDWLDPANTETADVRALLAPAATTGLMSYPVAPLVNSVRNNGPELIEQADPVAPGLGGRPDAFS
jgi:putative SOS response-associated peptidase YedK